MSDDRYIQSHSAGGSTGTVLMPIGGVLHEDAHWRHLANRLNRPYAVTMRPYVKLDSML